MFILRTVLLSARGREASLFSFFCFFFKKFMVNVMSQRAENK